MLCLAVPAVTRGWHVQVRTFRRLLRPRPRGSSEKAPRRTSARAFPAPGPTDGPRVTSPRSSGAQGCPEPSVLLPAVTAARGGDVPRAEQVTARVPDVPTPLMQAPQPPRHTACTASAPPSSRRPAAPRTPSSVRVQKGGHRDACHLACHRTEVHINLSDQAVRKQLPGTFKVQVGSEVTTTKQIRTWFYLDGGREGGLMGKFRSFVPFICHCPFF